MTSVRLAVAAAAIGLLPTTAAATCATADADATINAPYTVVYDTILDVANYGSWNPYITQVTPSTADLTNPGETFTLTVNQGLLGSIQANEKVFSAQPPSNGFAQLRYGYNGPLPFLLGNPVRNQDFTEVAPNVTYYETAETFCFLGLISVIATDIGFENQTAALKVEAEARWAAIQAAP